MIFNSVQKILEFAHSEGIALTLRDNCNIDIHYFSGQPPQPFIQAMTEHKKELVDILAKSNLKDPGPKETIENVFGATHPPTPQEDLMIDIDEIISYYNCHGLTIAELKAIGGKDWEEVKRNPNMAKEMANAIRAMKNNHPTSICDVPIEELKEKAGEDWQELIENSERLYAFAEAVSKQKLMEQGRIPCNYTAITHCKACGDVFVPLTIQNNGNVLGCPWCWNRARGFPVPRPSKFSS